MHTWARLLSWAIVLLWSTAGTNPSAEPVNPTEAVRSLVQAIGSIKVANNGALSPADIAHNDAVAKRVNSMLDIANVSQRILGRYWQERTPAEQKAFTDLLTELFVKIAYPKSAEFFADLQVNVTDERIQGENAEVQTTVSDPKEGLISVDYRLQQRNGTWHVRDIILDDVSLIRNLRSQCQQIIAEHSYDELIRRMQEKLNEEL
jgi:phospholipid transport system substrate-binding protein